MFKKLKSKIMIINFSLFAIIFISLLSSLYLLAWKYDDARSTFRLTVGMAAPVNLIQLDPGRPIHFIVSVMPDNSYTVLLDYLQTPQDAYSQIILNVRSGKSDIGRIEYHGRDYKYLRYNRPINLNDQDISRIASDGPTPDDPSGSVVSHIQEHLPEKTIQYETCILLTDITDDLIHLHRLTVLLCIVCAAFLVITYFTSRRVAHQSVHPLHLAFEREQQFIANVSHELKTPLTILGSNLAVVETHPHEPVSMQQQWFEYMHVQLNRMTKLVNDMLMLAKLESIEPQLKFARLNFSRLCESTLLYMAEAIYNKQIVLEYDILPELHIQGNLWSIQQLLDILVDNALKYTPAAGRIDACLRQEGDWICFSIQNTGEGILPEDLDQIFNRFYRVDRSGSRSLGGSGLGLSIARSVAQNHGGMLYAESRPGEYSRFIFRIPCLA